MRLAGISQTTQTNTPNENADKNTLADALKNISSYTSAPTRAEIVRDFFHFASGATVGFVLGGIILKTRQSE